MKINAWHVLAVAVAGGLVWAAYRNYAGHERADDSGQWTVNA